MLTADSECAVMSWTSRAMRTPSRLFLAGALGFGSAILGGLYVGAMRSIRIASQAGGHREHNILETREQHHVGRGGMGIGEQKAGHR